MKENEGEERGSRALGELGKTRLMREGKRDWRNCEWSKMGSEGVGAKHKNKDEVQEMGRGTVGRDGLEDSERKTGK